MTLRKLADMTKGVVEYLIIFFCFALAIEFVLAIVRLHHHNNLPWNTTLDLADPVIYTPPFHFSLALNVYTEFPFRWLFLGTLISGLTASLLHECGHALAAKCVGVGVGVGSFRVGKLKAAVYAVPHDAPTSWIGFPFLGGEVDGVDWAKMPPRDVRIVAAAGPSMNALWIAIFASIYLHDWGNISFHYFVLGLISFHAWAFLNWLPVWRRLDGWGVFFPVSYMDWKEKRQRALADKSPPGLG